MERWLPVTGFEGLYEVSDRGRVRSIPRTFTRLRHGKPVAVTIAGRVLTQHSHQGYMQVQLPKTDGGKQRNCRVKVSVLILEAFVGPRPEGQVARHLNDVRDDDRLENLQWGTPSENTLDSVRNRSHGYARRTHCKNNHEFTPENTFLRKGGGRGCVECRRQRQAEYTHSEGGLARRREYMREYRKSGRGRGQEPKTHCSYGHEYTPENTYVDKHGKPHCRECQRRRNREYYAKTQPRP